MAERSRTESALRPVVWVTARYAARRHEPHFPRTAAYPEARPDPDAEAALDLAGPAVTPANAGL